MSPSAPAFTNGTLPFEVPSLDKPCETWYRIYGSLSSTDNKHTPLLALHGGPGFPSDYMSILGPALAPRPVIIYDQLGNGRSTHLPETMGDTSFWTPELLLSELQNLVTGIGLDTRPGGYDVLGHSWGGMLAAMHAVTKPKGLRKLVLVSAPASMPLFLQEQAKLRANLPVDVQEVLTKHEKEDTTDSKAYHEAVQVFNERHMCLITPMPEEFQRSEDWIEKDPTVYHTMNGPSEFHVIGTIKDWSIVCQIPNISVPTLLLNGRHDEATDATMQPFFEGIDKVKWVTFENSSHTAMFEAPERFNTTVAGFLAE
ncbi:proline iminopeptidase [Pterulicium gracile]|uniref:Proline iminopeptidase n=1 Tax=Pterulicium gracile TaxID=1884261 RepID=A0A5C3QFQ5_9AGAR|nr:proline iminopeptidase [Pterula gracilis]